MDSINRRFIESSYVGKRLKKWKRKVRSLTMFSMYPILRTCDKTQ
jgi:hypothetical protein